MKFIDDQAVDDLAKSSTILQCILSFLDHECSKSHSQPEVIWVQKDAALIDMDHMTEELIQEACKKVNLQFQRMDKAPTCRINSSDNLLVKCEAKPLSHYNRLT